jgi:hypothetical protein
VEVYKCDGEAASESFALDNGWTVENGEMGVLIHTKGMSGEVYVDELNALGIDQYAASSLSNVIRVTVPIGQLPELAEQEFVLSIVPPSTTYVVP